MNYLRQLEVEKEKQKTLEKIETIANCHKSLSADLFWSCFFIIAGALIILLPNFFVLDLKITKIPFSFFDVLIDGEGEELKLIQGAFNELVGKKQDYTVWFVGLLFGVIVAMFHFGRLWLSNVKLEKRLLKEKELYAYQSDEAIKMKKFKLPIKQTIYMLIGIVYTAFLAFFFFSGPIAIIFIDTSESLISGTDIGVIWWVGAGCFCLGLLTLVLILFGIIFNRSYRYYLFGIKIEKDD